MSDKAGTPQPRKRVTRPDEAARGTDELEQAHDAGETAEVAEAPQEADPEMKARGRGPYAADGTNVIDADGRKVCTCIEGSLAVREASALWIASKLNA